MFTHNHNNKQIYCKIFTRILFHYSYQSYHLILGLGDRDLDLDLSTLGVTEALFE